MSVANAVRGVSENDLVVILGNTIRQLLRERITRFAFVTLISIILIGIFGPTLAPYDYDAQQRAEDGTLLRYDPPSAEHPLGTNDRGEDVLSRLLYGARATIITGFLAGSIILSIGLLVGVTSAYVGGRTDSLLMRFVDVMYGIPFIPFAIVLIAFFGAGFFTVILIMGLVLWRNVARVMRAQVLSIKQRPYIMAAKVSGAGAPWVIRKHILPNIASMAALFFALNVGLAIMEQAGLAFLGVVNPFIPTWGVMLRNVQQSGRIAEVWWWSFPPGIMISLTVLSLYLLGRGYEQTTGSDEVVV